MSGENICGIVLFSFDILDFEINDGSSNTIENSCKTIPKLREINCKVVTEYFL